MGSVGISSYGITMRFPASSGPAIAVGFSGNCANGKSPERPRLLSCPKCDYKTQRDAETPELSAHSESRSRLYPEVFLFGLTKVPHQWCRFRPAIYSGAPGWRSAVRRSGKNLTNLVVLRHRTQTRDQVAVHRAGRPSSERLARALFASAKLSPRINSSRSSRNCSAISVSGSSSSRSDPRRPVRRGASFCSLP